MDKYEFIKWMNTRLQNGRTIAEEIKFEMRLPTEEVENDPILSSFPSQKCITLIKEHKE